MAGQLDIEVILVRQLASYLTMPMIVIDPKGTLLFFNEAAEPLVGRRFEETDELTYEEWTALLGVADVDGNPLGPLDRPLQRTLDGLQPVQGRLSLAHDEGRRIQVEVTGFPLVGQGGRVLGAVAMFRECA